MKAEILKRFQPFFCIKIKSDTKASVALYRKRYKATDAFVFKL